MTMKICKLFLCVLAVTYIAFCMLYDIQLLQFNIEKLIPSHFMTFLLMLSMVFLSLLSNIVCSLVLNVELGSFSINYEGSQFVEKVVDK